MFTVSEMIRKVAKYKQLCVSYTKQWFRFKWNYFWYYVFEWGLLAIQEKRLWQSKDICLSDQKNPSYLHEFFI